MKKTFILGTALALCLTTPAWANEANVEAKVDYYMNKIDSDHNGTISKAEHDSFAQNKFSECDTNNDGMISREEMIASKKKEMAAMKEAMKPGGSDTDKPSKQH